MRQEPYLFITINIGVPIDEDELEQSARELINELEDLDYIRTVRFASTDSPNGSKGISPDWATILLTIVAPTGVLSSLVTVLGTWLLRDKGRSVEITMGDKSIKATGVSQGEQQILLDWSKTQAGLRLDK